MLATDIVVAVYAVEKVDSPIGDENCIAIQLCVHGYFVEKVDSPIGDENPAPYSYRNFAMW